MKRIIYLIILVYSNIVYSEGSEQLFGNWTTFIVNGKFNRDWIYYSDVGLRSTQTHKDVNGKQSYTMGAIPARFGIGYQFDPSNSILLGYLFQWTEPPYSKYDTYENRIWQQYQNVLDFNENGKLQNRIRFEQRLLTTSDEISLRWRQNVKYTYPLNKTWGFVFNEELFLNVNTVNWGPVSGIDQNRVFVGPVYIFEDNSRFEFGYMNNYVNKDLKKDLINHLFTINYYFNVN